MTAFAKRLVLSAASGYLCGAVLVVALQGCGGRQAERRFTIIDNHGVRWHCIDRDNGNGSSTLSCRRALPATATGPKT